MSRTLHYSTLLPLVIDAEDVAWRWAQVNPSLVESYAETDPDGALDTLGSYILRHGKAVKKIHSHFSNLESQKCRLVLAGMQTTHSNIRVVHGIDDSDDEGTKFKDNQSLRFVKELSDQDYEVYSQALLCAQYPKLYAPDPPPTTPCSDSPVSPMSPQVNITFSLHHHPRAIPGQSGATASLTCEPEDPATSMIPSETLCEVLLRAFGLSKERAADYEVRIYKPFKRKSASKILVEELSNQLLLIDMNKHPYYNPKKFTTSYGYETWRQGACTHIGLLMDKVWRFSKPHPKKALSDGAQRYHINYKNLMLKLIRYDMSSKYSQEEQTSSTISQPLSTASIRLLKEFALRYGVGDLYRRVIYLEYLAQHFENEVWFIEHVNHTLVGIHDNELPDYRDKIIITYEEYNMLHNTALVILEQCKNSLKHMKKLFPRRPADGISVLIELAENVLQLISYLQNKRRLPVRDLLTTCATENFKVSYERHKLIAMADLHMDPYTDQLSPKLLNRLVSDIEDEVTEYRDKYQSVFQNYVDITKLAAEDLYQRLMQDVLQMCDGCLQHHNDEDLNLPMVSFAYRLNRLDQDWAEYIKPSLQVWRGAFLQEATHWMHVLQAHCQTFVKLAIASDKFKGVKVPEHCAATGSARQTPASPADSHFLLQSTNSAFEAVTPQKHTVYYKPPETTENSTSPMMHQTARSPVVLPGAGEDMNSSGSSEILDIVSPTLTSLNNKYLKPFMDAFLGADGADTQFTQTSTPLLEKSSPDSHYVPFTPEGLPKSSSSPDLGRLEQHVHGILQLSDFQQKEIRSNSLGTSMEVLLSPKSDDADVSETEDKLTFMATSPEATQSCRPLDVTASTETSSASHVHQNHEGKLSAEDSSSQDKPASSKDDCDNIELDDDCLTPVHDRSINDLLSTDDYSAGSDKEQDSVSTKSTNGSVNAGSGDYHSDQQLDDSNQSSSPVHTSVNVSQSNVNTIMPSSGEGDGSDIVRLMGGGEDKYSCDVGIQTTSELPFSSRLECIKEEVLIDGQLREPETGEDVVRISPAGDGLTLSLDLHLDAVSKKLAAFMESSVQDDTDLDNDLDLNTPVNLGLSPSSSPPQYHSGDEVIYLTDSSEASHDQGDIPDARGNECEGGVSDNECNNESYEHEVIKSIIDVSNECSDISETMTLRKQSSSDGENNALDTVEVNLNVDMCHSPPETVVNELTEDSREGVDGSQDDVDVENQMAEGDLDNGVSSKVIEDSAEVLAEQPVDGSRAESRERGDGSQDGADVENQMAEGDLDAAFSSKAEAERDLDPAVSYSEVVEDSVEVTVKQSVAASGDESQEKVDHSHDDMHVENQMAVAEGDLDTAVSCEVVEDSAEVTAEQPVDASEAESWEKDDGSQDDTNVENQKAKGDLDTPVSSEVIEDSAEVTAEQPVDASEAESWEKDDGSQDDTNVENQKAKGDLDTPVSSEVIEDSAEVTAEQPVNDPVADSRENGDGSQGDMDVDNQMTEAECGLDPVVSSSEVVEDSVGVTVEQSVAASGGESKEKDDGSQNDAHVVNQKAEGDLDPAVSSEVVEDSVEVTAEQPVDASEADSRENGDGSQGDADVDNQMTEAEGDLDTVVSSSEVIEDSAEVTAEQSSRALGAESPVYVEIFDVMSSTDSGVAMSPYLQSTDAGQAAVMDVEEAEQRPANVRAVPVVEENPEPVNDKGGECADDESLVKVGPAGLLVISGSHICHEVMSLVHASDLEAVVRVDTEKPDEDSHEECDVEQERNRKSISSPRDEGKVPSRRSSQTGRNSLNSNVHLYEGFIYSSDDEKDVDECENQSTDSDDSVGMRKPHDPYPPLEVMAVSWRSSSTHLSKQISTDSTVKNDNSLDRSNSPRFLTSDEKFQRKLNCVTPAADSSPESVYRPEPQDQPSKAVQPGDHQRKTSAGLLYQNYRGYRSRAFQHTPDSQDATLTPDCIDGSPLPGETTSTMSVRSCFNLRTSGSLVDITCLLHRVLHFTKVICQILYPFSKSVLKDKLSDFLETISDEDDIRLKDIPDLSEHRNDERKVMRDYVLARQQIYEKLLQVLSTIVCVYGNNLMCMDMCGMKEVDSRRLITKQVVKDLQWSYAQGHIWGCRHMAEGRRDCPSVEKKNAKYLANCFEPISEEICVRLNDLSGLNEMLPSVQKDANEFMEVMKLKVISHVLGICKQPEDTHEFVVIELFSATSGADTDTIHTGNNTARRSQRAHRFYNSTDSDTVPKSWFQDETDIIFGHASYHVETLKRGLVNVISFRVNQFCREALTVLLQLELPSISVEARLRPLVEFLQSHFNVMRGWLYSAAYTEFMETLWSFIIRNVEREVTGLCNQNEGVVRKAVVLLQAIAYLIRVFHQDGKGISFEKLSAVVEDVSFWLQLFTQSETQLISLFEQLLRWHQQSISESFPQTWMPSSACLHQMKRDLHGERKCFSGAQLVRWLMHNAHYFTSTPDIYEDSDYELDENVVLDWAQKLLNNSIICNVEERITLEERHQRRISTTHNPNQQPDAFRNLTEVLPEHHSGPPARPHSKSVLSAISDKEPTSEKRVNGEEKRSSTDQLDKMRGRSDTLYSSISVGGRGDGRLRPGQRRRNWSGVSEKGYEPECSDSDCDDESTDWIGTKNSSTGAIFGSADSEHPFERSQNMEEYFANILQYRHSEAEMSTSAGSCGVLETKKTKTRRGGIVHPESVASLPAGIPKNAPKAGPERQASLSTQTTASDHMFLASKRRFYRLATLQTEDMDTASDLYKSVQMYIEKGVSHTKVLNIMMARRYDDPKILEYLQELRIREMELIPDLQPNPSIFSCLHFCSRS